MSLTENSQATVPGSCDIKKLKKTLRWQVSIFCFCLRRSSTDRKLAPRTRKHLEIQVQIRRLSAWMNRGSGLWNEIQTRQLFDFVESQVCILVKPSHLLFIDHEEVECEKATVAAGIPSRPVLEHLGVFQENLQLVFSGRSSHSRSFGGVLQSCTAVLWSEQVV